MNGMTDFQAFVADFRSVTGLLGKAIVAAPLADYLLDLGPPWPTGAPVITVVAELCVLILAFDLWRDARPGVQRGSMIALALLATALFSGYLYLLSGYTTPHPISGRIVHGYELLPSVRLAVEPGMSGSEILSRMEFQPERVWVARSITHVRLALLGSWLLSFTSLAGMIAVFVLAQRAAVVPAGTGAAPALDTPEQAIPGPAGEVNAPA